MKSSASTCQLARRETAPAAGAFWARKATFSISCSAKAATVPTSRASSGACARDILIQLPQRAMQGGLPLSVRSLHLADLNRNLGWCERQKVGRGIAKDIKA